MNPNPDLRDEASTLRLVIDGTIGETGAEFFRALVRNLVQALGTHGAWVTEYLPTERRLRALAMHLNGGFVEHFEYPIANTPCAEVVESRRLIHIPERVVELYPDDPDLAPLNAVSYLGTPLLDTDGTVLGHLSILDNKPMPRDPRAVSLFEVFAARATAEHRRLKFERALREREEEVALLLENAMDAILVVDRAFRLTRVNPAAERLLGGTPAQLLGRDLADFLDGESTTRIQTFTREIARRPNGQQQLWVPQNLTAQRLDHSRVQVEATLSRFERRAEPFLALILRNADERLAAERTIRWLTQETEYLREVVRETPGASELTGESPQMRLVFDDVRRVAQTDSTVLITGETGTGKELVARSIHRSSRRADQPLVVVNCAAIPLNLIESEFFGHERGAFTGAANRREGRFAMAHRGTIFLDEVGELPLEVQAKLLRVIQEGEFEPLGATKTVKVDVRIVAATHRDLPALIARGAFREDLYFRLHVFPIRLPPLRDRGRDLDQLATAFLQRLSRRLGRRLAPLTEAQLQLLHSYSWPGNVRELQNVLERAILLASGSQVDLERAMVGTTPALPETPSPSHPPTSGPAAEGIDQANAGRILTLEELEEVERSNLRRALEQCSGKIAGAQGAARLLGVPPSTLTSRLKALGLRPASH